jgi:NADH dehydrogenase
MWLLTAWWTGRFYEGVCLRGTGFVGSHLVDELLRCGHQVRLLVHHRAIDRDGVEHVEGDATSPESFEAALSGCDAVVNLVGIIRNFRQADHLCTSACGCNSQHAGRCARHGIKRYLHMSALGTRDNAVSNYHRTKFMAEELVRRSKLDWTIFRPSLIYGPGMPSSLCWRISCGLFRSYQ